MADNDSEGLAMSTTEILVPLDPDSQVRLARLAAERQQSAAELAAELLASFLDPDSPEHQRIRSGLDDFAAGRTIAHQKVSEWLESWGTANELQPPQ
jgi:predicted transcriptional regulator